VALGDSPRPRGCPAYCRRWLAGLQFALVTRCARNSTPPSKGIPSDARVRVAAGRRVRLFSENKGAMLLAALVAGLAAGNSGRK
jgi:hypothetical protein